MGWGQFWGKDGGAHQGVPWWWKEEGWSPQQLPLNLEAEGEREGDRLDGYLRVSGTDRTPLGTLGIELFLVLFTCARPWGQEQNHLRSLPALEELPAWDGRGACSPGETVSTWGLSWGQLPPGADGLPGRGPGAWPCGSGGEGQPDPGRSVCLDSGKVLVEVELTKI